MFNETNSFNLEIEVIMDNYKQEDVEIDLINLFLHVTSLYH